MSARHWFRAWGVAAGMAALPGIAWAQAPATERTCGTHETSGRPAGGGPEARERGTAPETGVRLGPMTRPFAPIVNVPSGPGHGSPPAPVSPPPVVGAAPQAPAPPAVPGLPPVTPASKDKEEEEDRRKRVEAIQAEGEVPEERLLDVGIAVFDAGVGEKDRDRLVAQGLSPELRRAEGRFVAFHLKKTMEGTGNWGAVRVLPGPGEGLDVFVSGKIVQSNGKRLALEVEAIDATGRRWLERRYEARAELAAYRPDRIGQHEPFQEVYNRIANDLLAARDKLEVAELATLRRVAALRFSTQLAPEAFATYLKARRGGRYALLRFPADGDPMFQRVSEIRDRDQMLVDTLNEHYLSFYERMNGPYSNWRQQSWQEQDALDRIKRESLLKQILGGAVMIAGVALSDNDSQRDRMLGDLAVIGGYAALQAGARQRQEGKMHEAAIKELAMAADAEVAPLLVEVEGKQVALTGSAEKQFTEWRELLRQVFSVETGPGDPNAPVVVTPGPSSR